jgi:hypothetical protein
MNNCMENLDRLGWAAGLTFRSYGMRIGIRTNRPEILDRVADSFPPGWQPASSPLLDRLYSLRVGEMEKSTGARQYSLLYADSMRLIRTSNLDEAFAVLESNLKLFVAEFARRRVFVHAGVVGWQGRAIIFPGHSFSGKTSLVAELVRAGATYYSDEYAVLDGRGRVHSYPAPLGVRQAGSREQKRLRAEELEGVSGTEPLPVGLIVLTRYKRGRRFMPRRLSAGRAMLELLANSVPVRRKPEAVLKTLEKASGAVAIKSLRGEARETARLIIDYMQGMGTDKK